jgi:hypothetical protein
MNILELDSYRLGDAVKFNDKLNPKLWGSDEHLHPQIREQLLRIAEDFAEFLLHLLLNQQEKNTTL